MVAKTGPDGKIAHLWLLEANGGAQQICDGPMHEGSPVWSPDGSRIAYFGRQGEAYDIFARAAQVGAKAELLVKNVRQKVSLGLVARRQIHPLQPGRRGHAARRLGAVDGRPPLGARLDTVYAEGFATLSPDGRWIAYQSDQSGRNEVYVQTFDGLNNGTRRRWMVSKGGGLPRWRADGSEVFYMTTDGHIMSVAIRPGSRRHSKPDNRRCFSRRGPSPRPGIFTTSRPTASVSRSTFRSNGPPQFPSQSHKLDRKNQGNLTHLFSISYM